MVALDHFLPADLLSRRMIQASIPSVPHPVEPAVARQIEALEVVKEPEAHEHRLKDNLGQTETVEQDRPLLIVQEKELVKLGAMVRKLLLQAPGLSRFWFITKM